MIHTVAVLPSLNEPATVAAVTEAVDTALDHPDAMIVLADASPTPDTVQAFRAVSTRACPRALAGLPEGKGIQVLTALGQLAGDLAPDARILLADTDTRNPDPDTYRALLAGLDDGAAIALADYSRFWDEANLTNHLARPLIALSTGYDVAQPLAGDVALTATAVQRALREHDRLDPALLAPVAGYGIDTFLLQAAAATGHGVTSVPLPTTKAHAPSFPHLPAIFADAVPVLLAPACRSLPATAAVPVGDYRLTDRSLPGSDLRAMCTALRELHPGTSRYHGAPWPDAVARTWFAVVDGVPPTTAARWLWPAYLEHVLGWLDTGHHAPPADAAAAARTTANTILDLITAEKDAP